MGGFLAAVFGIAWFLLWACLSVDATSVSAATNPELYTPILFFCGTQALVGFAFAVVGIICIR